MHHYVPLGIPTIEHISDKSAPAELKLQYSR